MFTRVSGCDVGRNQLTQQHFPRLIATEFGDNNVANVFDVAGPAIVEVDHKCTQSICVFVIWNTFHACLQSSPK